MTEVHGEKFNNGDNCEILSFVSPDNAIEMDVIDIDQAYPAGDFTDVWAHNERSNMMAVLVAGSGRIAVRETFEGVTNVVVTEFGTHNAAYVPAGSWYSWQSDPQERLTVAAAFVPPFDPDGYSVATTEQITAAEEEEAFHATLNSNAETEKD